MLKSDCVQTPAGVSKNDVHGEFIGGKTDVALPPMSIVSVPGHCI